MGIESEQADRSTTPKFEVKRDLRFITIVLVITIIPFLIFGKQIETLVHRWIDLPMSNLQVGLIVAGLLWADIILPVPSSVVTTFAGAKLGWFGASLASNLGMTCAAITAFALGRLSNRVGFGCLSTAQVAIGEASVRNWGPWAIVLSRGIPLVAEIVLIYVAAKRMPFRHFFWPTLFANSAICLGYALLGQWAADREWLGIALGASGVLPLLLGLLLRKRMLAN